MQEAAQLLFEHHVLFIEAASVYEVQGFGPVTDLVA
jgi:hypothetical protein